VGQGIEKMKVVLAITALCLGLSRATVPGAEPSVASAELDSVVKQIQTKLNAGHKTEADLADELSALDQLLAEHKGEKTEDVAQMFLLKARLYLEVFDNSAKGAELIRQLKADFPNTKPGQSAATILENIKKHDDAEKIQKTLAVGNKFPDFEEKDVSGKPLSIGNYAGKVVLVDFWATSSGPCVQELPSVIKAYNRHHAQGFEIIGISLDQDEKKLKDFTKQMKMPWPQYFDGKGWNNKLALRYGIQVIPFTFLLDGNGTIIGKSLQGQALEEAVTKALAKKS
jgi:peroxiredoxin